MKVALDVQSTLGRKTGIGHYTAQLAAALRRAAPPIDLIEISMGKDVGMRTDRRLRWQQVTLPHLARSARADLLHVPGFDAPLGKPCPVVLTIHDLIGKLFPQNLPPVSRWYWSRWLPRSARWADRIVADSLHTKRDIVTLLGIPEERIAVIYPAADERFQPVTDPNILGEVRQKYRLPSSFILYLGTLEPRKGLGTLISAYRALAEQVNHSLVIAGNKGWQMEPLFRLVEDYGLAERVYFTGYVEDGDLPGLLSLAETLVYPSTYEGFGLPPLEAMACGTPVVCSNAASLPEVVGEAGLLVPPGEAEALFQALARVITDESLHAGLRRLGFEQARRFSWDHSARQMIKLYESVL